MAEKLLQYYKYITDAMGIEGKSRLAIETKVSTINAAILPDSPENIKLFKKAIKKITNKPVPKM
jgi:hypothetical protein